MKTPHCVAAIANSGGRCRTILRSSTCASMPSAVSVAGTRHRRSAPTRNGPSSRARIGAGSTSMSVREHLAQFNVARVNALAEQIDGFVWQTLHKRFYGRRQEWFEHIETPLVLWFLSLIHI